MNFYLRTLILSALISMAASGCKTGDETEDLAMQRRYYSQYIQWKYMLDVNFYLVDSSIIEGGKSEYPNIYMLPCENEKKEFLNQAEAEKNVGEFIPQGNIIKVIPAGAEFTIYKTECIVEGLVALGNGKIKDYSTGFPFWTFIIYFPEQKVYARLDGKYLGLTLQPLSPPIQYAHKVSKVLPDLK